MKKKSNRGWSRQEGLTLAGLVVNSTVLLLFILFVAGVFMSSGQLIETKNATVGMKQNMDELQEQAMNALKEFSEKFPQDQPLRTVRALLDTLETIHRLSAALEESLSADNLERDISQNAPHFTVGKMIHNVTDIIGNVKELTSSVNPAELHTTITDAQHLVANAAAAVDVIDPAVVQRAIGGISAEIDSAQQSQVVEHLGTITVKLDDILTHLKDDGVSIKV